MIQADQGAGAQLAVLRPEYIVGEGSKKKTMLPKVGILPW